MLGQRSARENLNALILRRLKNVIVGSRLTKAAFFTGAVAVAGICQYTNWPPNGKPSASQIVGICASVVVFLTSVITLFTDLGATGEIAEAHRAVSEAELMQQRADDVIRQWPDIESMVALHQVISLFRDHLETACVGPPIAEDNLLCGMVTLVERQLPAAADFTYADPWTICLYRAVMPPEGDRFELRLVEHLRAIKCEKGVARVWVEGKGISGVAFSNAQELVISDMADEAAQALYKSGGAGLPHDSERYRSMAVVPVILQGEERPWGLVVGTSSRVNHFNNNSETGLKPIEAIRALAHYAAFAVSIARLAGGSDTVQCK